MQGKIEGKEVEEDLQQSGLTTLRQGQQEVFISSTKTLKIELDGDGRFITSPGVERPEGQLLLLLHRQFDGDATCPTRGEHLIQETDSVDR